MVCTPPWPLPGPWPAPWVDPDTGPMTSLGSNASPKELGARRETVRTDRAGRYSRCPKTGCEKIPVQDYVNCCSTHAGGGHHSGMTLEVTVMSVPTAWHNRRLPSGVGRGTSQTVTADQFGPVVAERVAITWSVRWVNVSSVHTDVGCEPARLVYTVM